MYEHKLPTHIHTQTQIHRRKHTHTHIHTYVTEPAKASQVGTNYHASS